MLSGTRSFISQMAKMVGPEPIESSNGNATLLNTYVVSHCMQEVVCNIKGFLAFLMCSTDHVKAKQANKRCKRSLLFAHYYLVLVREGTTCVTKC